MPRGIQITRPVSFEPLARLRYEISVWRENPVSGICRIAIAIHYKSGSPLRPGISAEHTRQESWYLSGDLNDSSNRGELSVGNRVLIEQAP